MPDVTQILNAIESGDPRAAADLLPLVYDELRRLAAAKLAHEKPGQTLDATALVHEAFLRLAANPAREGGGDFANRRHFFAAAAEAMRRILIENARRKRGREHGGGRHRVGLADHEPVEETSQDHWLDLDEALTKLTDDDPDAAEIAKLRLFAGLSVEEAAEAVGQSRATAYRHWTYARAWLRDALGTENP